jgi:hypothetical protein
LLINNAKEMNFFGLDLNCGRRFCDPAKYDFAGMIDESRPTGVRATDAAFAVDHVSSLRGAVSRRAQDQVVLLPGPVSVHGLRTRSTSSISCLPAPGAFYIMDPGFLDFERLYRFHEAGSFFVTRGKANLRAKRRYSHPSTAPPD